MKKQIFIALACVLSGLGSTDLSADLISVDSGNLSFVSSNGVDNGTSNLVEQAFDGIYNFQSGAGFNGATFDLTAQNPSVWEVDMVKVGNVSSINLYQKVGGIADNGIRDFTVTFYDGENLSGSVLHTESFTATLNPDRTAEVFTLSTLVERPESFSLSVTSAFGNQSRAEFSEFDFEGTAVPEPVSTSLFGALGLAGFFGYRRRKNSKPEEVKEELDA